MGGRSPYKYDMTGKVHHCALSLTVIAYMDASYNQQALTLNICICRCSLYIFFLQRSILCTFSDITWNYWVYIYIYNLSNNVYFQSHFIVSVKLLSAVGSMSQGSKPKWKVAKKLHPTGYRLVQNCIPVCLNCVRVHLMTKLSYRSTTATHEATPLLQGYLFTSTNELWPFELPSRTTFYKLHGLCKDTIYVDIEKEAYNNQDCSSVCIINSILSGACIWVWPYQMCSSLLEVKKVSSVEMSHLYRSHASRTLWTKLSAQNLY